MPAGSVQEADKIDQYTYGNGTHQNSAENGGSTGLLYEKRLSSGFRFRRRAEFSVKEEKAYQPQNEDLNSYDPYDQR